MSDNTIAGVNVQIQTDLGKEAEKSACRLLERLVKPAFVEAGQLLGDQVKYWKWCNYVRLAEKVEAKMKAGGVAERAVPPCFSVPLIEAAANVEDESLQDMWAQLLTSAVADEECEIPAYIETLKQLTRKDAERLKSLTSNTAFFVIRKLMNRNASRPSPFLKSTPDISDATLQKLGILDQDNHELTPFGRHFLKAVSAPREPKTETADESSSS